MRWDELFDDLAGQAESIERTERNAEVADRTRAEIGQTSLVGRLRSSTGRVLALRLTSGVAFSGTVVRLGLDWMLLACPGEVVVPLAAVATVADLPWETVSAHGIDAVSQRLTLSSALRAIAVDRARVTVVLRDGSTVSGTPDRVGRDFVDLAVHHRDETPRAGAVFRRVTVAYPAISAVARDVSAWE